MDEIAVILRQLKLVQDVEAIAKSRRLGARFQSEVQDHLAKLTQAVDSLRQLHEILDLSDLERELGGRKANREFWSSLAPGRYAKDEILSSLVTKNSITLNTLYKASLEFIAVTRFADNETQFAIDLGDRFRDQKRTWELFKRFQPERRPLVFHWHSFKVGREFFGLLQKHKVIESYSISLHLEGQERHPSDRQTVERLLANRKIRPNDRIIIEYTGVDPKLIPLVTGLWFEAYAYKVFEDTLARLADDYEIYSRVDFEAQEHLREKTRSDFDILVGLPDQVILAECKSGAVTKDAVQRMIFNSKLLRRIFGKMGVAKYLFLLIFSPTDEPDQTPLLEDLIREGFVLVEPYNIAPFLNAHIQNQAPQTGLTWAPRHKRA